MNSIIKFIKTSGIFFLGNVFAKAIIFFLLPLYTTYLPTAEYGYYDLSITYVTIITAVAYAEIWSTALRHILEKNSWENISAVITNCWMIFFCSTASFVLIGLVVSRVVSIEYLTYIIIYGISQNMQQMYSNIARGKQQNRIFAVSGIINAAVMALLNVALIKYFSWGIRGLYLGAILGNIVQMTYLEYKVGIIREVKANTVSISLLKRYIRFTTPLSMNAVAYWLLTSYNRIVISNVLSLGENGIYAVGSKFGNIIALVTSCFTFAWQDISFSRKAGDEDNGPFFSEASSLYLQLLGIGLIFLLPFCKLCFPILISSGYSEAEATLPLFLIMSVVNAYSTFVGNIFYAINKTQIVFFSTVVACVTNLLISEPLIRLYGIDGANIAIIVSFGVNLIIRFFILYKHIGMRFLTKHLSFIAPISALAVAAYYKLDILGNIIFICVTAFLTFIVYKTEIYTFTGRLAARRDNGTSR